MIGKLIASDLRRTKKVFMIAALFQIAIVTVLTVVFAVFDIPQAANGVLFSCDGIIRVTTCFAVIFLLVYIAQTCARPHTPYDFSSVSKPKLLTAKFLFVLLVICAFTAAGCAEMTVSHLFFCLKYPNNNAMLWGNALTFSGWESNFLFILFPMATGLFVCMLASSVFMAAAIYQKIAQKTGAAIVAVLALIAVLFELYFVLPLVEQSFPCNLNYLENGTGYVPANTVYVLMTGEFFFARTFLFTFNILSPTSTLYIIALFLQNIGVYSLLKAKNRHFIRTVPFFSCALIISLALTAGFGFIPNMLDGNAGKNETCGAPQNVVLRIGESYDFGQFYRSSANLLSTQPPNFVVYLRESSDGEEDAIYRALTHNDIRQTLLLKNNQLTFYKAGVYHIDYEIRSFMSEYRISDILDTEFIVLAE